MAEEKGVPYGYCYCGCGSKTPVSKRSNTKKGHKKGEPTKFCRGHRLRKNRLTNGVGYIWVYQKDHPNSNSQGYIPEHVLIASKVLGKPIKKGNPPSLKRTTE